MDTQDKILQNLKKCELDVAELTILVNRFIRRLDKDEKISEDQFIARNGFPTNKDIAPAWSNVEPVDKGWEPVEGMPGVYRDPRGIFQWVKKGEVPKSILEQFNELELDDEETAEKN